MAKERAPALQMSLPGMPALHAGGKRIPIEGNRIPYRQILHALQDSESGFKSIVGIYRERVLPIKNRNIPLLGRKCNAQIIKTLLGYEVKASYKRIHCPDMVTAQYLKLFTELGCRRIRLPYDPTVTASLIPDLEEAFETLRVGVRGLFPEDRQTQRHAIRALYRHLRTELHS